jgi:hypothetical protein
LAGAHAADVVPTTPKEIEVIGQIKKEEEFSDPP